MFYIELFLNIVMKGVIHTAKKKKKEHILFKENVECEGYFIFDSFSCTK